jgi:hypothetical protein
MPISARKMDRTLVSVLGFERRMGRHQIYILRIGGKQVARTLISHGVREIGNDLMAMMARQMALRCPNSRRLLPARWAARNITVC